MTNRYVVVTGASRGLGRTIALALARGGFSVLAGVRRREDGEAVRRAALGWLEPLILDVTSGESLRAAAAHAERVTAGRGLAGLVNNAGVVLVGPLEQVPLEAVEDLFRVNVLGVIAATQQFLPLLRKAAGRIINISAVNGKISIPFLSVYNASKSALEALSDSLRVELAPWGIRVSVVAPGAMRTDIRAEGVRRWAESRASLSPEKHALYERQFGKLRELIAQADSTAAEHDPVTQAVYDALTAEVPQSRYLAGPDTAQWMQMASLPDAQRDAAFLSMLG